MRMARPVTGIQAPFPTCGTEWIRRCWRFFGHLPVSRSYDRLQHVIRDNSGESPQTNTNFRGLKRLFFSCLCFFRQALEVEKWIPVVDCPFERNNGQKEPEWIGGLMDALPHYFIVFSWAFLLGSHSQECAHMC